jgi:hypothetical protein
MKVTWIATMGFLLVVGLPLAASAGPNLDATDTDGDGVNDAFDNCVDIANSGQADADHNGCGDACQIPCDANNDGIMGGPDFACVIANFGTDFGEHGPPVGSTCDCNGDGIVGGPDFAAIIANFGKKSGISGIPIGNPLHDTTNCFPKL